MKLLILALLLISALLLASCGDVLSAAQMASAVQTLTATVLPPTHTSTPDPDESAIVMLLNKGLEQTSDPLSQTIDAHYQVVDASFQLGTNMQVSTFRIDARCECIAAACCTPERTFVVIVAAMKPAMEKIARQVPSTVTEVQVVCLDRTTPVGMISVAWYDLKGYFTGAINGFQLGARTVRMLGP